MNNDDSEMDYALQIIEELKNKRFKFQEEAEPNGKKYTFIVSNNEEASSGSEVDFLAQLEDSAIIPEPDLEVPENLPETTEDSNSNETIFVPKNLIKNFVCAFSNFTHDPAHEASCLEVMSLSKDHIHHLDKIRAHLKSLLRAKRFNTTMLEHLLSSN